MILTYDFDGNDFEYEPDESEIESYIEEQPIEVITAIAEETFSKMSEQERSEVITEILNSGDVNLLTKHQEGTNVKYSINWQKAYDEDKDWVLQFVDADNFTDELHDYFYRAASDAYDNAEAERNDPYGYRGVSERDFY